MALYELSASQSQTSHRPSTCSTARFGHLSSHSFFTRHNAQPSRVRHIVGLLGNPICHVNDNGYEVPTRSPRVEKKTNFPPNYFNEFRVNHNSWLYSVPNDTASRALNNYISPPSILDWRSELRMLAETAMMAQEHEKDQFRKNQFRQCMYSPSTGRLLPPPSRAMSRRLHTTGNRLSSTAQSMRDFMSLNSEVEKAIFTILCQILQTEDAGAVQNWLTNASEREKSLALDIIQAALSNKDEYMLLNPSGELMQIPETAQKLTPKAFVLPPIVEKSSNANNSSNSRADYLEVHANEAPVLQHPQPQDQENSNSGAEIPLQDNLNTIFITDVNKSKDSKRPSSTSSTQRQSTWNPNDSY